MLLGVLMLSGLLASAPAGATPPPGGSGPVSGDLSGRWEIGFQGLPRAFARRLVVRFTQDRTRVQGQVLVPASRAFVTGKMLGRFYLVEVRPVVVAGATTSYALEISLDPSSTHGLGSVRARLERGKGSQSGTGSLKMRRLDPAPPGTN